MQSEPVSVLGLGLMGATLARTFVTAARRHGLKPQPRAGPAVHRHGKGGRERR
jgi:prephenate dehydrogenase